MLIPKSLMHPEKYSAEVISKRLSVAKKKIEKQTKKPEELNEQRKIQADGILMTDRKEFI